MVNDVGLAAVTVAVCPLHFTVLVPIVAPKLVPVMVMDVPACPVAGVKLVMVGTLLDGIVKDATLLSEPYVAPAFMVPRKATFCIW